MTANALTPTSAVLATQAYVGRILVGCLLMFVVLQGGLNLLFPRLDLTWSSLIVAAAMLGLAFVIERFAFDRAPRQAAAALGFGRPRPRALIAGGLIAVAMLAFFPIYSIATGTPFVSTSKTADRARDCSTISATLAAGASASIVKPIRICS